MARCISLWSHSKPDNKITLNQWQEEAMDKAIAKPFQLIQGPPGNQYTYSTAIVLHEAAWSLCIGTGKSVTGAHIAYVLAKVNKSLQTVTPDSHKCVLYCGPSNKSVEVVFGKHILALNRIKVHGLFQKNSKNWFLQGGILVCAF